MIDENEEAIAGDLPVEEAKETEKVLFTQLTKEIISEGLSLLCRIGSGLAHAFVKLDLKDKALDDIAALSSYIHIRFLDISNNHISDLSPLASLNHLLWLKVDKNAVASLKDQPFADLKYLQWLSVAANRLTDVCGPLGPALASLNLTGNSIQQMSGLQSGSFSSLTSLELRGNRLETTNGLNLPNLQRLYLAQNFIKRLEGLENLERLTCLHLRENKLKSLDGLSPNMKCLQYLNVRRNEIAEEKSLQNLGLVSKTLQILVLSENPLTEADNYRLNVLKNVTQLERLDKTPVSTEERMQARWAAKEKEEEIPEA